MCNKPKELLDYLVEPTSGDIPNYSLLSLETQNYIAYNHNWDELEKALKDSQISQEYKTDLLRLLDRNNLTEENEVAITWSKYSSKPILTIEMGKIAEGLILTVDTYTKKRNKQKWYKGRQYDSRIEQMGPSSTA